MSLEVRVCTCSPMDFPQRLDEVSRCQQKPLWLGLGSPKTCIVSGS